MAKFTIALGDPRIVDDKIGRFWGAYLPGTPLDRLTWMMEGNPAGPSVWLFAHEEKKNILAATISIMPKVLNLAGKKYRAGIVGDFMVTEEYRVFGPALQIMRYVIQKYNDLGFDFIYTVPNEDSFKICQRAGFVKVGTIRRFRKILNPGYGLKKNSNSSIFRSLIIPVANACFRVISRDTYRTTDLSSDQRRTLGADEFHIPTIEDAHYFIAHRDRHYLAWRYLDNPLFKFSIDMYRNKKNDEPRGLVISTPIGNATHIFDVVFRDQETLEGLIVQFSKEMQKKGFSSASIRLLEGGPYSRVFEKMNFRPREDSAPLMAFGDESLIRNLWFFTDGDRNI